MMKLPRLALFGSLSLALIGAGFAGGWYAADAAMAKESDQPIAPAEPIFTDMGLFHINFGNGRQIGSMRAGLLVTPEAAKALSPATQHDQLLDLLVRAAENPVVMQETKVGPGTLPMDQVKAGPGTVKPDLERLAALATYISPEWMLQLKLVSASNPPLLQPVEPPQEVRPLEEDAP